MQPPPAASRKSLFSTAPTSTPASANISPFPTAASTTPGNSSNSASLGTSPRSSLRNPPSPISFAPSARRPTFDLAAELLHSAGDLREATDGERRVCVPTFPAFLANALSAVLIQAKAFAVEREAAASGNSTTSAGSSSIPALSRSMALLACLRHALPPLSALTEPYLLARESLVSMAGSSSAADTDLLEFVLDKADSIPFVASSTLCGPTRRLNLSLSKDTEKYFSTAAHSLAVDRSQVVVLAAAYTLSSQHHLLAQRYRDLAADIVGQYEIRATFAAKTTIAALEMVQADIAIRSKDRERA